MLTDSQCSDSIRTAANLLQLTSNGNIPKRKKILMDACIKCPNEFLTCCQKLLQALLRSNTPFNEKKNLIDNVLSILCQTTALLKDWQMLWHKDKAPFEWESNFAIMIQDICSAAIKELHTKKPFKDSFLTICEILSTVHTKLGFRGQYSTYLEIVKQLFVLIDLPMNDKILDFVITKTTEFLSIKPSFMSFEDEVLQKDALEEWESILAKYNHKALSNHTDKANPFVKTQLSHH